MSVDALPGSDIPGWEIAAPHQLNLKFGLLEEASLLVEEAAFGIDPLFSTEDVCLILSGAATDIVRIPATPISDPKRLIFRYPVGRHEQPALYFTRLFNEFDVDGPIANRSNYARFLRALIDIGGPDLVSGFDKRRATDFIGLTMRLKRTEFPVGDRIGQIYLPVEIAKQ